MPNDRELSDHDLRAARLRAACELHDAGVALMRQNLRRRHPEASAEQVERMLVAWLHTRPGAEQGDGPQIPGRGPGPDDGGVR